MNRWGALRGPFRPIADLALHRVLILGTDVQNVEVEEPGALFDGGRNHRGFCHFFVLELGAGVWVGGEVESGGARDRWRAGDVANKRWRRRSAVGRGTKREREASAEDGADL